MKYEFDTPYYVIEDWENRPISISIWYRIKADDVRKVLPNCLPILVDFVREEREILMHCQREKTTQHANREDDRFYPSIEEAKKAHEIFCRANLSQVQAEAAALQTATFNRIEELRNVTTAS